MTAIRFNRKQDFIDALEARRKWAEQYDAKITAKHKADEKAALAKFRTDCRAAVKKSYEELTADRYSSRRVEMDYLTCPRLIVPQLDMLVRSLTASRQERYTVKPEATSGWANAYWMLTHDETAIATPC